ncbi:hypothetical protein H6G81_18175 [Scytonema hofmannii FACHB-248]|uniref:Uncharacterized protein n=1 Tax=Scytonema hofmannii FACHB-248 TaxID=1842502 RepID=A0ABR8GT64_9CYAN|nr:MULTISPECIES: hypothetical protein [Nostocales]MBD2606404.1 hypothetical protein [Scytonema hofmannii FACHB-248]
MSKITTNLSLLGSRSWGGIALLFKVASPGTLEAPAISDRSEEKMY